MFEVKEMQSWLRSAVAVVTAMVPGLLPVMLPMVVVMDAGPAVAAPGYMLQRFGSGFCLNAYRPGRFSRVNLWDCDRPDGDQHFELVRINSERQGPMQWMVQRRGTDLCLNAYQPKNGSTVNLYRCDREDVDQVWEMQGIAADLPEFMLRRAQPVNGKHFCLNAHKPGRDSRVNLWRCDETDPDQLFTTTYLD